MKLYRIEQNVNTRYDTYDSAVIAAESTSAAKHTHPCGVYVWRDGAWYHIGHQEPMSSLFDEWASPSDVEVVYIGEAKEGTPAGVILTSYNAG